MLCIFKPAGLGGAIPLGALADAESFRRMGILGGKNAFYMRFGWAGCGIPNKIWRFKVKLRNVNYKNLFRRYKLWWQC